VKAALVNVLGLWNDTFVGFRASAVLGEWLTEAGDTRYVVFFYDQAFEAHASFRTHYASLAFSDAVQLVLWVEPPPWSSAYLKKWTFSGGDDRSIISSLSPDLPPRPFVREEEGRGQASLPPSTLGPVESTDDFVSVHDGVSNTS
jgi:hypothetical protein